MSNESFMFDEFTEGRASFPVPGDFPIKGPGFQVYIPHDWAARAWGFRRAADALTERAISNIGEACLLLYPIMFLYRHQLELDIKQIIVSAQQLLREPFSLNGTHALKVLWNECQDLLARVGSGVEDADDQVFLECLQQLDKLDPQGIGFRYPVTMRGIAALPQDLESIDLVNLKIVMGRMSLMLDCIQEDITQRLNYSYC